MRQKNTTVTGKVAIIYSSQFEINEKVTNLEKRKTVKNIIFDIELSLFCYFSILRKYSLKWYN